MSTSSPSPLYPPRKGKGLGLPCACHAGGVAIPAARAARPAILANTEIVHMKSDLLTTSTLSGLVSHTVAAIKGRRRNGGEEVVSMVAFLYGYTLEHGAAPPHGFMSDMLREAIPDESLPSFAALTAARAKAAALQERMNDAKDAAAARRRFEAVRDKAARLTDKAAAAAAMVAEAAGTLAAANEATERAAYAEAQHAAAAKEARESVAGLDRAALDDAATMAALAAERDASRYGAKAAETAAALAAYDAAMAAAAEAEAAESDAAARRAALFAEAGRAAEIVAEAKNMHAAAMAEAEAAEAALTALEDDANPAESFDRTKAEIAALTEKVEAERRKEEAAPRAAYRAARAALKARPNDLAAAWRDSGNDQAKRFPDMIRRAICRTYGAAENAHPSALRVIAWCGVTAKEPKEKPAVELLAGAWQRYAKESKADQDKAAEAAALRQIAADMLGFAAALLGEAEAV